uniref:Uncharacterized protein n=1 Tax=Arundo donax TaxID=35708 RepID=A0A0A9I0R5_ARUDO
MIWLILIGSRSNLTCPHTGGSELLGITSCLLYSYNGRHYIAWLDYNLCLTTRSISC